MDKVIKAVIPEKYLDERTVYHINPCGQFVLGGPQVSYLSVICLRILSTNSKRIKYSIFIYKNSFSKYNKSHDIKNTIPMHTRE